MGRNGEDEDSGVIHQEYKLGFKLTSPVTFVISSMDMNEILRKHGHKRVWTSYGADVLEAVLRKEGRISQFDYYNSFDPDNETLCFTMNLLDALDQKKREAAAKVPIVRTKMIRFKLFGYSVSLTLMWTHDKTTKKDI